MSHKIPEAEAVELMLAKNLRPLESYPGRAKPWRCECLICKNIVTPRLASIRLGQGGCVYCAGKATISEEEARKILKGANPKEIQEWVGHASIEETMDTYGHLFPNAKHQLSSMLDKHAKRYVDVPKFGIAN